METATLSDIDSESIGLLSTNDGGLGAALWKGTMRLVVERLMPALNLPTFSAALNDLARRFLLTTATVPEGTQGAVQSLTSMRIEKLVMLGDVADAWKLAQLAKPNQIDEITLRLVVEDGLVSNVRDDVCAKLPDIIKAHTSVEWQKSLLICQLRANDTKAVQVSLDLLHAQGVRDDAYFELVEKTIIAGRKQLPRQLTPLKPLTLALMRMTDLPFPGEVYAHPDAALIPELLLAKPRDDAARLNLAERAAERGLITSAQLEAVYTGVVFPPENLANPINGPESGARQHALLYQAAAKEQPPQTRINEAIKFMATASPGLLTGSGSTVLADMVGSVQPAETYYPVSSKVAEIEMLGGKPDAALGWLKLAKRGAVGMPGVATDLQNLWPVMVFAGLESDSEYATNLTKWLDAAVKSADPKVDNRPQREQAASLLLLLDAAGFAVAESDWAKVMDAPSFEKRTVPGAIILDRLRAAGAGERRGEAVISALLVVGGNANETPLFAVVEVIRALRQAGLNADAGLLARETAMMLMMPAAAIVKP